jgi:hypothetical protein
MKKLATACILLTMCCSSAFAIDDEGGFVRYDPAGGKSFSLEDATPKPACVLPGNAIGFGFNVAYCSADLIAKTSLPSEPQLKGAPVGEPQ